MTTYRELSAEMSKTDQRQLESRIAVLIEHLLKLRHVTGQVAVENVSGWNTTIRNQRDKIAAHIRHYPGLKPIVTNELLDKLYQSVLLDLQRDYSKIVFPRFREPSLEEIVGPEIAKMLKRT